MRGERIPSRIFGVPVKSSKSAVFVDSSRFAAFAESVCSLEADTGGGRFCPVVDLLDLNLSIL